MLLKGRGRAQVDSRTTTVPPHLANLSRISSQAPTRPQAQLARAPLAKPEPDYEVVEYPSDQYVNAKLQPPPPPPRPAAGTGHLAEASAPCGLCGGGGARVRCTECGRRALCASCDDMYHRHPKRRHHQRQALSPSQLIEVRPPLPPKANAPVPPPRRHKLSGDRSSASPRPPPAALDQRRATVGHLNTLPNQPAFNQGQPTLNRTQPTFNHSQPALNNGQSFHHNQPTLNHQQQFPGHFQNMSPPMQPVLNSTGPQIPMFLQSKQHMGSVPYLPGVPVNQPLHGTMAHNAGWARPRGSLTGFNSAHNFQPTEAWESQESVSPAISGHASPSPWSRPMRRGASVLDLGAGDSCGVGCAHCVPNAPWAQRYGSCVSLDHTHAWPAWQAPPCCMPHGSHVHSHHHPAQTPQAYRRDSRAVSRAASRTGSRAASPAMSTRSRASRRTKHRTPTPPSSDADSESDSDSDRPPPKPLPKESSEQIEEDGLGPAPSPPSASWQCEHCTFVNEAGVRVCAVCCKTPVAKPRIVPADVTGDMTRMSISGRRSPEQNRLTSPPVKQNGGSIKSRSTKERTSTGCGPSPPRDQGSSANRLSTPHREQANEKNKHDMAVGPSPPRDSYGNSNVGTYRDIRRPSPYREKSPSHIRRPSPYREKSPSKHSVSVGPSPPRESLSRASHRSNSFKQKMSPSRERTLESSSSSSLRANVSTTGTSPPPQSISTQTYEAATWDREREQKMERERARELERVRELERSREVDRSRELERARELERSKELERERERDRERAPSASRSRARRRLRDDTRRERSHSRHSLSSDTRESERSAATAGGSGGGRWEWVSRDSPPEWSGSERRLPRRASHLDLRRNAPLQYHSQGPSPEPLSSRCVSLEALAAGGRLTAQRGLELARLMADAERLGFTASEVHAALAQNPLAPLSWLRDRWPSLVKGVRAAAARLAAGAAVTEREARAALARHRGALWPAVNDCVDRHRRQMECAVSSEARIGGRVWGSPAGADDDAAPARAYDSSDEFEATPSRYQDDDWMYMPLDQPGHTSFEFETIDSVPPALDDLTMNNEDVTLETLKSFLRETEEPPVNDRLFLKELLANNTYQSFSNEKNKRHSLDFLQSESDFIDAYNALARTNPLPNNNDQTKSSKEVISMSNGPQEDSNISLQTIENADIVQAERQNHTISIAEKDGSENISVNQQETVESAVGPQTPNNVTEQEVIHNNAQNLVHSENVMNPNIQILSLNTAGPSLQSKKPLSREKITSTSKEESRSEPNRSDEDRGSNLSEIVDSTQKLIQQMKEEINSDITSLDGQSLSHSDADNSSNESDYSSEHRTSYSETERETDDDLTSDDNETENKRSQKSNSVVNRTSSEDNEQFEEAMDHIEEQTENFRQTNIEILNSIARSLREEQTISIEINQTPDLQVMEPMAEPEEVMVEAIEKIDQPIVSNHLSNVENEFFKTEMQVGMQVTPGEPIETKIEPLASKSQQGMNNNMFKKVSSFEEIYDDLSTSVNSIPSTSHETPSTVFKVIHKPVIIEKKELVISLFKAESPIKLIVNEQKQPVMNALLENIDLPEELPIETNNNTDVVNQNLNGHSTSPDDLTAINDLSSNEEDKSVNSPINSVSPSKYQDIHDEGDSVEERIESANSVQDTNDTAHLIESETSSPVESRDKSISPEKSAPNSPGGNSTNKFTSMIKSNIPKLIKILPNKQRGDKSSPKVVASKVPIRRGSLKQHSAPTPPKSHFGNVQNGHVKQLRTKLFNDKPAKPPTVKSLPAFDVQLSMSSSKKRQAPPPPQPVPGTSDSLPSEPIKEKQSYFRETCRTEDEWTDSDSGDSQLIRKPSVEEPIRAPSPPPPVTLRRVSGQLVDLARVRLLEGSPERQARMLLAEGALETWQQAQLAVELVSRGSDPPAALLAALQCIDLDAALAYLHQDCELCASRLPEHEMVSMLCCTHRCCHECARHYFTVQITERSIADCVCPYCKEPQLEHMSEDAWLEYFAHLDILLKTLLENDTHELFQRKLRDRTLALDPNFKWCVECSSGFFVSPKQKKLRCPECRSVSCASCRKPWTVNHEGLTCEQYASWVEDNDPERSVAAVQQHLRENGLECPRCRFKYSLSRGGCMHFTCTQCKFEFCYGCGKPFTMGARCGLSEYCAKLGLHAHHPRNCLFYLRDKEPHELQTLLQMNGVSYETAAAAPGGAGVGKRCAVPLQRETPTGLVDSHCGGDVPDNHAGLCKNHYLEYLSRLVRSRELDPLPILGVDDLETLVRRAGFRLPPKPYGSLEGLYKRSLLEIVREKIPLD